MGVTRPLATWCVLGIVAEAPTHGFAVARELAPEGTVGRLWSVPRPLVYRAIGELIDEGLIGRVGSEPGRGGPRRTLIAATAGGQRALGAWLLEPVMHVRDARSELLVKLQFLARRGEDPMPLVARQRARLGPMSDSLREQRARAEGFDEMVLVWRLEMIGALERFLDEVERQPPRPEPSASADWIQHV